MKSSYLVELGTISTKNFFGKKSIKQVTRSCQGPIFNVLSQNAAIKHQNSGRIPL